MKNFNKEFKDIIEVQMFNDEDKVNESLSKGWILLAVGFEDFDEKKGDCITGRTRTYILGLEK